MQEYLRENALDAFLVLTKLNRKYLSGFTGSAGVLLIAKNSAKLYVDDRYTIRARRETDLPVHNSLHLPLTLSGRVPSRIGIEDRITLREFQRLKKNHPRVSWKITHNIIESLRAVKEIGEIREIREGSRIIDATFRHLKKFIKPGMTETAVALEIERFGKKLGAQALAFDPIVAFGANAAAPHHFSSSRKIGRNNFLLLDFGFLVEGYNSDFTRTLFVGKLNKRQEKIYQTVLEAQTRAIGEIGEGVKASRIDSVARRFIGQKGFGRKFTHNTGHGVGLEIHELPNFSPDSEDILQQNMIVTVEPGIYIEGWGGVRIEDMVLVGEKPTAFSKIGKELEEMIID